MNDLVVIFRTHSEIEASIVRGLLDTHGIHCLMSADVPHSIFPLSVNGLGEVLACRIDPSLIASGDRELIEDLLPAAINEAVAKSKAMHAEAMKSMAEGMNVPGLDGMLAQLAGGDSDKPGHLET